MWLRCMGGVFLFGQKENLDAPITRACAPQSQLMVVCWWDICGPHLLHPLLSLSLFFLFIFTCLIFILILSRYILLLVSGADWLLTLGSPLPSWKLHLMGFVHTVWEQRDSWYVTRVND